MDEKEVSKITSLLENIDRHISDLSQSLKKVSSVSRLNLIEKISCTIVQENSFLNELGFHSDGAAGLTTGDKDKPSFIDQLLENITEQPTKKVILLREAFEKFPDISESDKNVIIQALKDEKVENLKEKILNLVQIFGLTNLERRI